MGVLGRRDGLGKPACFRVSNTMAAGVMPQYLHEKLRANLTRPSGLGPS